MNLLIDNDKVIDNVCTICCNKRARENEVFIMSLIVLLPLQKVCK